MGKGFNNYMTKKFFHPSSKENIKRVWMAQQKTEFEKKKEDDMVAQYRKEQDVYENRALLGDEKAKMGLSFMYDAPPGLKKAEKEKEEGEPEYKFEWQRKFNAPREQYAKNDETIRDQPFGIEVRNVRCIKCRQWGHVNTDRICPLFGKDLAAEPPQPKNSASSLLDSMREDGFTLKQSLLGRMANPRADNEQMLPSDDEDDPEVKFLKSLTAKQKKKLLKKLNRLQEGKTSGKVDKKKKKKEKRHKPDKKRKDSYTSEEDSEEEEDRKKKSKKKNRKLSASSDSQTDDERHKQNKEKANRRHSPSPEQNYRHKTHNKNKDVSGHYSRDKYEGYKTQNRESDTLQYDRDRGSRKFDNGKSSRSKERIDRESGRIDGESVSRRNRKRSSSSDQDRGKPRSGGVRRRSIERHEREGEMNRFKHRQRLDSTDRERVNKKSHSPEGRRIHKADVVEFERSGRHKQKHRKGSSFSEESDSSVERNTSRYGQSLDSHDERISSKYRKDKSRSTGNQRPGSSPRHGSNEKQRSRQMSYERQRSRSPQRQRSYERNELRRKGRAEHPSRRDKRSSSKSEDSSSD